MVIAQEDLEVLSNTGVGSQITSLRQIATA